MSEPIKEVELVAQAVKIYKLGLEDGVQSIIYKLENREIEYSNRLIDIEKQRTFLEQKLTRVENELSEAKKKILNYNDDLIRTKERAVSYVDTMNKIRLLLSKFVTMKKEQQTKAGAIILIHEIREILK